MNAANVEVHANDVVDAESFFGFEDLAMVNSGEVLFFTMWGNDWSYGIFNEAGTMMSIYTQLSDSGVPSCVHVTFPSIRRTFRFRIARRDEYAALTFSYGFEPRAMN